VLFLEMSRFRFSKTPSRTSIDDNPQCALKTFLVLLLSEKEKGIEKDPSIWLQRCDIYQCESMDALYERLLQDLRHEIPKDLYDSRLCIDYLVQLETVAKRLFIQEKKNIL